MVNIEPDQLLNRVETSLDKLTELILCINKRLRKPKFYRDILNRRINLTKVSRQLRGEKTRSITIDGDECETAKNN